MSIIYDIDMYNAFRKRAVTDASRLEIGKAYYSNYYRGKRILKRLLTHKEYYAESGLETDDNSPEIQWAEFYVPKNRQLSVKSLSDNGITEQPYNPWLIFESEEDAELCRKALKVIIEPVPWDY